MALDPQSRSVLIQQYGEGPAALDQAWLELPEEARQWKPGPDDWSAHEIVVHCADSETYAAVRIRLLASEDNPLIVGYDQEQWARTFAYANLPVHLAQAAIAAVRANTWHLIQQFNDETWLASGRHTESGPYSAEDWLLTYSAHLHEHAEQIRSNYEQWKIRGEVAMDTDERET